MVHAAMAISVVYTEKMVANAQSFSPSAGKPREVVASWRQRFPDLVYRAPQPASIEELCLAHSPHYVREVLAFRAPNGFGNCLPEVAAALPYTSGAMIEAARAALHAGVGVAPVSGFHHACYAEGGGYCTFNGLVVAAQVLRREGLVQRVGILDFDEHYGNGTADIIRQLRLGWIEHYSAAADWDRPDQASAFLAAIPSILQRFAGCDVLLYQAGADPHIDDPLGGWLTTEQLRQRDRAVFDACRTRGLPIAWNLAGGYQTPLRRVLDIHDNTMAECLTAFSAARAR
jgi:acetoin utilization deacetylase AcuC-like enzyme